MKRVLHSLIGLCLAVFGPLAWAAPDSQACPGDCGIFKSTQSYPHLVVGVVQSVLSEAQSQALYEAGRNRGTWRAVAATPEEFVRLVRPVIVQAATQPKSPAYVVLMGQDEYVGAPVKPGDLVRYSPHDAQHPRPTEGTPASLALWDLYGCVAILCSANDGSCSPRYWQGLFSKRTGQRLSYGSAKPMTAGPVIDTTSMLPVPPAGDGLSHKSNTARERP